MFALRPVCLWPGLPQAWMLGIGRSLFIALGFTWGVCWLLLATFVWPDWVSTVALRILWCTAVLIWLVATIRNCWYLPRLLATSDAHSSQALVEAQTEYLRGNWFEAEAKLLQVLHVHPRDSEALLLLVGVLRRTQRWQPALRKLNQLTLLESAQLWQFEIERERQLLDRAQQLQSATELEETEHAKESELSEALSSDHSSEAKRDSSNLESPAAAA